MGSVSHLFPRGLSANPGGRRRLLVDRIRTRGFDMVDTLLAIAFGRLPRIRDGRRWVTPPPPSTRDRLRAIHILLDIGYGRQATDDGPSWGAVPPDQLADRRSRQPTAAPITRDARQGKEGTG